MEIEATKIEKILSSNQLFSVPDDYEIQGAF